MRMRTVLIIVMLIAIASYGFYWVTTSMRQPPTPPSPPSEIILRWINPDGVVLDGNVLNPGKEVKLEEIFNDVTGPEYFGVFEVYDSIFDWLVGQYGNFSPIAYFEAMVIEDWIARSDASWLLPAPLYFRGQSTFRFQDDRENWSGWITSTSLGSVILKLPAELKGQIGTRESGTFEVKGGVEIEGELIFASDPRVSMVLLLPWGRGEADLINYLSQYLGYLEEFNPEISPEAFFEHFKEYLPLERPEGWDLSLSPESILGSPSEPGKFTLKITTPSPGKTLLAVKAILDGDPSRFVISEIIGIEGTP